MTVTKTVYTDHDIDLSPLRLKKTVIIGYGNQGRPQALNLRDSQVRVSIGVREGSTKREQALADGFDVMPMAEAIEWADVVMCLLPDEVMGDVYERAVKPHLKPGQYLGFGHGLAIHAGWVRPEREINVFLVAPKGQGRGVRNKYTAGSGVPGFFAVHRDFSGDTQAVALAYARAIGCGRTGVFPTTFEEETVCDLFSEQAVLCGGLTRLITGAFETLVDAGYSEEAAYFECLYEVKLIADLLHEKGIAGMREGISSTALYGDIARGDWVIDGHVRENMRRVLGSIRSGEFVREMKREFDAGRPLINEHLLRDRSHRIEQAHRRLARDLK